MQQWLGWRRAFYCAIAIVSFSVFAQDGDLDKPKSHSSVEFVGSKTCIECHKKEAIAWQGSDHDMAMRHASPESVRGNFDNYTFNHKGKPNRFFRKGDEYWVNIQGPDGMWQDYKVSYTFGWKPLQQYMVEFEDGRVQLIPFAWDTRARSEGGQRWFHLYPNTSVTDEFYWTNTGQNWNFMCADCHSTNLKKNYDIQSNTYATSWSEINVGCEACHGPASEHVRLVKSEAKLDKQIVVGSHYGFDRDLSKAVTEWVVKEGHSTLQPKNITNTNQVQVCAQCHSRRTQLNETSNHVKGSFFDAYRLSLITPELYYQDGQIYDEDYVYGSFLQSEMAEKGVTCTNCHDPHTATLKIPEEAVCSQCHIASEYTPEKHTFHEANSEASKCTTCHMPETTYMQVDPRRDHSWHVPRPDLSQHINTPNVCTSCHADKNDKWADQKISEWFPDSKFRNKPHFSVAFYAADIGHQGASNALAFTAQDSSLKAIIRGSALERMGGSTDQNTTVSLLRAVKSDKEMIRLGAIEGSSGYEFSERWKILQPLLDDPVLSVRVEAASALVSGYAHMSASQKERIQSPLDEYIEVLKFNSDRGFGRTNLANVYRGLGETDKAISLYEQSIKLEPYYENSYVNLADVYRSLGEEGTAFSVLEKGMAAQPNSSMIPYSAGLSLLRQGNDNLAQSYLKQAAINAETNAHYWYVYGLSLEKDDVLGASKALNTAFTVSGNPEHLYAQCETLARNYKKGAVAFAFEQCTNQLSGYVPKRVVDQLKQSVFK